MLTKWFGNYHIILQDTKQFAYSFQSETPIRQGHFSNQDRYLLDRIIAQVNRVLLFFMPPAWKVRRGGGGGGI